MKGWRYLRFSRIGKLVEWNVAGWLKSKEYSCTINEGYVSSHNHFSIGNVCPLSLDTEPNLHEEVSSKTLGAGLLSSALPSCVYCVWVTGVNPTWREISFWVSSLTWKPVSAFQCHGTILLVWALPLLVVVRSRRSPQTSYNVICVEVLRKCWSKIS